MSPRPSMSAGRSRVLQRCAVQTGHTPVQRGRSPARWVRWVAAILNSLVKLYPAETAVLRQIFPTQATARAEPAFGRRFQHCLRSIDCTRNPVERRRMRRKA
jgi:hypothetical protein